MAGRAGNAGTCTWRERETESRTRSY